MKSITKKDILNIILIFVFTLISRSVFTTDSGNYFGTDPSLFALGANNYSIINNRPHLPGYFLHIESIKMLTAITDDHSISMVWLSIIYSSLAVIFLYLILRKWFNSLASMIYSLLFITNPFVWFYGCVPEIYAFDMFFSSAIILCGLSGRMIYLTPVLLALGTGVRQSSGVLMLPIYIFLWITYYRNNKQETKYIIIIQTIGVVLLLSWFIPMANSTGGLKKYIELYRNHGRLAALSGIHQFIINQIRLVSYCYTVFIPLIYPIMKWFYKRSEISDKGLKNDNDKMLTNICFWWVVPIFIFFIFYHYNKGYLLLIMPGIVLYLAYLMKRTNISVIYIISIIAVQIAMFIYFPSEKTSDEVLFSPDKRSISKIDIWLERLQGPYSMSYSTIRNSNAGLQKVRSGIAYCNKLFSENKYTGYFISSTAQVVPTTLHVLYPRINIYYYYRGSGDNYSQFFSLVCTKRQGMANMIGHAVIITSDSFYNKYLRGLCKPIYVNGDITFSVVINGQQEKFSELYLELF